MENLKIIIVDDDEDYLEVITQLVKLKGIEVVAVGHNGKEAVELYEQYMPDVILLDMSMPEYDGNYAIERIAKLDSSAKVILISGVAGYSNKSIVKIKIVHHVVKKPYAVDALIEKILN